MKQFIFFAGIIQLSILSASILTPFVLDYKNAFSLLKPMLRKIFMVYSIYIFTTILFLGLLSTLYPAELLNGGAMKMILLFYSLFWGGRLFLQFFVYDMSEFLTNKWLKIGYHLLTVAFIYLTVVYLAALITNLNK